MATLSQIVATYRLVPLVAGTPLRAPDAVVDSMCVLVDARTGLIPKPGTNPGAPAVYLDELCRESPAFAAAYDTLQRAVADAYSDGNGFEMLLASAAQSQLLGKTADAYLAGQRGTGLSVAVLGVLEQQRREVPATTGDVLKHINDAFLRAHEAYSLSLEQ